MDFFAANIKFLRLQKGLKQHDFQDLGFTRTQWNNYEKLVSRPKVGDIVKIANFFGFTETQLMHSDLKTKGNSYSNAEEYSPHSVAEVAQPYSTLKTDLIESLQLNVEALKQLLEFKDVQIQSLRNELDVLENKMNPEL